MRSPRFNTQHLRKNAIGLTRRDYEGAITTLCAGCGHDSITAAIIQAFYLSPDSSDVHEQSQTFATPLAHLPYEELCPGSAQLEKRQRGFR